MTPKEVLALCREKDVKAVNIRFCDLFGNARHLSMPITALGENTFSEGIGFNGSAIAGWQSIDQSDLVVIPQQETAFIDPFTELTTLNIIGEILDPITLDSYSRDPRLIAKKTTAFLNHSGVADSVVVGPEAEFYVFDEVRFEQDSAAAFYFIDCADAKQHRGRDEPSSFDSNPRHQPGYASTPPADHLLDLRNEMMQTLIACGLSVERHHHEAGTAGQSEINLGHGDLVSMADNILTYKYVVKNVARQNNKTATFMPKPVYAKQGSGMHLHFSLWKEGRPLFAGNDYAGLSETALFAIGGILRHAGALSAFSNPTTNSYKRLASGFSAPMLLTYSQRNRSAACRIPVDHTDPNKKRIEVRFPDPSCNPYLAFSAMTMAAIDGIQNKIDPGESFDGSTHELEEGNLMQRERLPGSLDQALQALQADCQFLLKGDVFTDDVIKTWISHKRNLEVHQLRTRPHPYEFCLYYDV